MNFAMINSYRQKNRSAAQSSSNGKMMGWIAVIFIFGFIVQRDISMPSWVILAGALITFFALFALSLRSPLPAFLVLACYIPFSKVLVGDFGGIAKALNFTNILMIFVLMGMFAQFAGKGKPLFEKNSLNIPIFMFCLISGFGFFRGMNYFGYYGDFIELLSQLKRWLTPPLIFYLAYNSLRDKEAIKNVIKIIMVVVALVGLMAAIDYINIGEVSSLEKARIGGIADQPNQLAAFFVYYMFLYAGFFLVYFPSLTAWAFLIPLLIAFRGIMVTFSRGGYLSFALGAFATGFFRNKLLFIMMILLSGFLVLNQQFLPEGIRYRMGMTFEQADAGLYDDGALEDNLEMSSGRRLEIWKTGLEMIKDQPLVGHGYGTFPYVLGSYNPGLGGWDAHNSYIIMAAETGIPSVIAFMLIVFIFLKNSYWVYRHTNDRFFKAAALGVLGGIFGLLLANMFGSRLDSLEISGYFWILAGIILRIKSIERAEAGK